eukprot:12895029-Alexandrium_andersonii.AAC.1
MRPRPAPPLAELTPSVERVKPVLQPVAGGHTLEEADGSEREVVHSQLGGRGSTWAEGSFVWG